MMTGHQMAMSVMAQTSPMMQMQNYVSSYASGTAEIGRISPSSYERADLVALRDKPCNGGRLGVDPGLVLDPISKLAKAEEKFYSFKLNVGKKFIATGERADSSFEYECIKLATLVDYMSYTPSSITPGFDAMHNLSTKSQIRLRNVLRRERFYHDQKARFERRIDNFIQQQNEAREKYREEREEMFEEIRQAISIAQQTPLSPINPNLNSFEGPDYYEDSSYGDMSQQLSPPTLGGRDLIGKDSYDPHDYGAHQDFGRDLSDPIYRQPIHQPTDWKKIIRGDDHMDFRPGELGELGGRTLALSGLPSTAELKGPEYHNHGNVPHVQIMGIDRIGHNVNKVRIGNWNDACDDDYDLRDEPPPLEIPKFEVPLPEPVKPLLPPPTSGSLDLLGEDPYYEDKPWNQPPPLEIPKFEVPLPEPVKPLLPPPTLGGRDMLNNDPYDDYDYRDEPLDLNQEANNFGRRF